MIRRVCRSTLQAEALRSPARQTDSKDAIKLHKVTECGSLYDHLAQSSGGEVQDKRLAIDLCGLGQIVWRQNGEELGDPMMNEPVPADGTTKVRWCSTKTMLADGLTKHMDTSDLRQAMAGAQIAMEFSFHAKRKTDVKTTEHSCQDIMSMGHIGQHKTGMET